MTRPAPTPLVSVYDGRICRGFVSKADFQPWCDRLTYRCLSRHRNIARPSLVKPDVR